MQRRIVASLLAPSLFLLASVSASAQTPPSSNAQRALQWLQCTQQQANGQIGAGGNPIARSSEVAIGLAAAGQQASAMHAGATSLADYLTTATSTEVGTNGELLLARASVADAGPVATVAAQLQAAKGTNGEYGGDIYSDALAILGLRAAGQPVADDAVTFLKGEQKANGGWSADNADQYGEDSNTTALVIQALIGTGIEPSDPTITKGFTYLQSVFADGGFGGSPGAGPDPNSDELATQAILAAHLQSDAAWQTRLDQALSYLAGQQLASGADAGAISSPYSKLFASTDAPAAFLRRPLTAKGVSEAAVPLLACPAATTATATPHPTQTTAPILAQTGRPADGRPVLGGLALLAVGLCV
ncbi:MAG TPA: hypothetical protein VK821_05440, partial [Dehalococcoidia bacterium]|nr:hypothetical protein [Dehalococcoidia bacterium]